MRKFWNRYGDFIKILFVMFIVMAGGSIVDLLLPVPSL